jgi:CRP-like cAMP-binding protein
MSSLAHNPIFRPAGAESLQQLVDASSQLSLKQGERILSEGEPAKFLYSLERGAVKVFHRSENGDEVLLKLFRAPAVFGEAEALVGIPHMENVETTEPSELLAMPIRSVLRFLRAEPECAVRMLIDVSARLAIAAYNEKSLAFHPSTVRLANYLVDYLNWTLRDADSELRIDLTQDQMASAIGVTRRSVAKDMIDWQEDGILQRQGRGYIVCDIEALRRYADSSRLSLAYDLDNLFENLGLEDGEDGGTE